MSTANDTGRSAELWEELLRITSRLCNEGLIDPDDVEIWRIFGTATLWHSSVIGMMRARDGLARLSARGALDTATKVTLAALHAQLRAIGVEPAPTSRPVRGSDWADVVRGDPDPDVIGSEETRKQIIATGYPWRVRSRETGIELLLIPRGEYLRGAGEFDTNAKANEMPAHRVLIDRPFYLGRTEVTNEQFQRFNPTKLSSRYRDHVANGDDVAVSNLRIRDIDDYCHAYGLRLPSHAEWEYAGRAGSMSTRYGPLVDIGWSYDDVRYPLPESKPMRGKYPRWREGPFPVGTKAANAFGMHDMIGNLSEVVGDRTTAKDYSRFAGGGVVTNPFSSDPGGDRICCGGFWRSEYFNCRVSGYFLTSDDYWRSDIGFRVAHDVP